MESDLMVKLQVQPLCVDRTQTVTSGSLIITINGRILEKASRLRTTELSKLFSVIVGDITKIVSGIREDLFLKLV